MKVFLIIFSVFILFLSISPCCDSDGCIETSKTIDKIHSTSKEHQDKEHQDFCSPFCVCACCSHSIATSKLFQAFYEITIVLEENYKQNHYTSNFLSKFEPSIWQPPKIA